MTDYATMPGVNWSKLKLMRKSPLHYQSYLSAPRTESAALRIGLGIHCRVLEPEMWQQRFAVYTGRRAGKQWDAFAEEHTGLTILTETEHRRVRGATAAILEHPAASQILHTEYVEHAMQWVDPETCVLCKGRCDAGGDRLVELKSTGVIEPHRFAALAARMGYHAQIAYYMDGLRYSGSADCTTATMIVVEQTPPHDVIVYDVGEDVIEAGRREYRRLLALLQHCRDTDTWPGIAGDETMPLVLPEWAYADQDDVEITIGGEELY